jgi:hypothetical protein
VKVVEQLVLVTFLKLLTNHYVTFEEDILGYLLFFMLM